MNGQSSSETTTPRLVGDRRSASPTKGERQRRALLDGFAELLATRPLEEIGILEIAREAGVGRSAFYAYFDSKYAALAVLTSEAWSIYTEQDEVFVRREGEQPEMFLERIGDAGFQVWKDHAAVLVASIQAIPSDTQIAAMWELWNNRLVVALAEQLEDDRRNGLARPVTQDVTRLIKDLNQMSQHAFYLNRARGDDEAETQRMVESLRAIWLAAAWGVNAPTQTAPGD